MVIARKLLLPTLAVFAILLIGMAVFFGVNTINTVEDEQARQLLSLSNVFEQDLQSQADVSLALAKQVAGNPEVIQAVSSGDRLKLITLTFSAFKSVQPLFNITQQQFIRQPSEVLLRLQDIERFGDNLPNNRMTVINATTLNQDISGLELAEDGLGLRGVAVFQAGRTAAVVDIGIAVDQKMLDTMKRQYGGDWQLSLTRSAMKTAGYAGIPAMKNSSLPELTVLGYTRETPLLATADAYRKALAGEVVVSSLSDGGNIYSIISTPLRDYSNQVIGVVDITQDRTEMMAALRSRLQLAVGMGVAGLLVIAFLLSWFVTRTLRPIGQLTAVSQAFAEGDLSRQLPASLEKRMARRNQDELDRLATSFNSMANQLRRLVGNLEDRVSERTQDLERRTVQLRAVADITRDVTTSTDVQSLLEQAVQLVRQRFEFYHAGVFLVDESGEWAVLRAATGEAGRRMIEAGHRLRVNQVGIVGSAAGTGQPHVTQDVTKDSSYYANPNLPDTRSEMGLPLRLGTSVIGVLDVQSVRPNAFDEGDIAVLQILADQLAIAFNNARLIQELNRSVKDMQAAYGSLTRQTWSTYVRQQTTVPGYQYRSAQTQHQPLEMEWNNLQPLEIKELEANALQALETNQAAIQPGLAGQGGASVAMPIRLRDEPIGVIHLKFDTYNVPPELVEMLEEVGSRLGLVLESARLLHEAQRLAAREQQINVIATQMRSSVDLDAILQNTVRELGKALGARRTFIQLGQTTAPQVAAATMTATRPRPPEGGSNGSSLDLPGEVKHE